MAYSVTFGGAGAKILYQAGVCKRLVEMGFDPSIIVGTSSGSIAAAFYASGQTDILCDMLLNLKASQVFKNTPWKVFTKEASFFDSKPLTGLIRQNLNVEALKSNPRPVLAIATNLTTWQKETFILNNMDNEDIITAIVASCSIPVAFPLQTLQGNTFCDGGIVADYSVTSSLYEPMDEAIIVTPNVANPFKINNMKDLLSQLISVMLYSQLVNTIKDFEVFHSPTKLTIVQPNKASNMGLLDFDKLKKEDRLVYMQSGYADCLNILKNREV